MKKILRKIISVVVATKSERNGRDKVLLECGHEIWVNQSTIYKTHCFKCLSEGAKTVKKNSI